MKRALRWAQWALFTGAFAMLAYCGFVLFDAWNFQKAQSRQFNRLLTDRVLAGTPAVAPDGLIGRIEVPRLGLAVIVMEGTGTNILRRAAGHITGTALPGEPGNVGISGHRDTFFRPLRNIRKDDVIVFTTLAGEYRYRVVSTSIVSPDDVAVLQPTATEILTVVTCYPFYFVGAAPDRFIVRAERIT
ncbi:MAG: class D sortase [Bryobacteraceae bacterium]|jgi:sortase A